MLTNPNGCCCLIASPGFTAGAVERWHTTSMKVSAVLTIAQVHRRDRARRVAAYVTVALAVLSLISAASRPFQSRLLELFSFVPVGVPQASAVFLVFFSFVLIAAARYLRRGSRLAWTVSLIFLLGLAVLHLLKGIDVPMATLSGVGAAWLVTQYRAFPVLPTRTAVRRAAIAGCLGLVVGVAAAAAGVTHMARISHVSWQMGAHQIARELGGHQRLPIDFDGPIAILVMVTTGLSLLALGAWLLLWPRGSAPLVGHAHREERERARVIVDAHGGGTLDYFALRDDKQWLFISRSVVAYAVRNKVCVISPDPIGPDDEAEEVWAEFLMFAERNGWSVTVLAAAKDWVPIYEATGLRCIYLGDEAIVNCQDFSLSGQKMKSLRHSYSRVQRAGFTCTHLDPRELEASECQELEAISTKSRQGDVERGFSMTLSRLFDPEDTGMMMSIARDASGAAQAFIQWVPAEKIGGWSLDVMRRNTDADLPNGVIDFLIIETIRHIADQDGQGLGLNFAVMRTLVAGEGQSTLARTGQALTKQASKHTQIESLWRFNSKYDPDWVPRYTAIGSFDLWAGQGLVMAQAEGVAEIPVVGRLLQTGRSRLNRGQS